MGGDTTTMERVEGEEAMRMAEVGAVVAMEMAAVGITTSKEGIIRETSTMQEEEEEEVVVVLVEVQGAEILSLAMPRMARMQEI
jgi:hypothetical protein